MIEEDELRLIGREFVKTRREEDQQDRKGIKRIEED
jgi:hypothetical protein